MDQEPKPIVSTPATPTINNVDDMTTLHERSIAALSYLGPLAVIPLFLKRDSKFCRFHGQQGLLLFIIFFLAQLFAVLDLIQDAVLIAQVAIFLVMGLAALSGRWTKFPIIFHTAEMLGKQMNLKNKEEDSKDGHYKPDETPKSDKG